MKARLKNRFKVSGKTIQKIDTHGGSGTVVADIYFTDGEVLRIHTRKVFNQGSCLVFKKLDSETSVDEGTETLIEPNYLT